LASKKGIVLPKSKGIGLESAISNASSDALDLLHKMLAFD
jgi:hypothetical protein